MNYIYKEKKFVGKWAGTNLKHFVYHEKNGQILRREISPFSWEKLDCPDKTTEITLGYILDKEVSKLNTYRRTEYAKWQRANKNRTIRDGLNILKEIKKLNFPEALKIS